MIEAAGLAGCAGRWALAGRAQGAREARRRACVGARACGAGSWARRRGAQWARRRAERHGRACGTAGARGRERQQARARGAGLAGRQARSLALGCALGALGLFSICFRLDIFPESLNEHCSL